jgi:cobalt-zinc-cadmium efflux system outer membrane protein
MNARALGWFPLFGIVVFGGCAVRRYQAVPIVPTETASKFQSRSLNDAGLQGFIQKNVGRPTGAPSPKTWDVGTLWLAAQYFNPTLGAARARVGEAEAAVVTAGARPNPTLGIAPGVPSPYLLTLDFAVPVEAAGKRRYRTQAARNVNEAAEFDLAETAWSLRSEVRAALLGYVFASRNLDLLHSDEQIRGEQASLLEQRFTAGEIPRPEVDLARIQLSQTRLAISAAEGQVDEDRAVLAAVVGVPAAAFQGVEFSWPDLESPPSAESLSAQQLQRDAVLNRLDVRRSLAQYAAAEAELQLEIAKQYPDLAIGPGYAYEEKNNFFTIGLSTTLPVFNRNQGPIAEAEARRREAAAVFLEKQAQVIAQSEQALALYSAALKELNEAQASLSTLQDEQEQMVRRAVAAGEEDSLTLNGALIESSAAAHARLEALRHALGALGALEDAVQRPLDRGDVAPVPSGSPAAANFSSREAPVKEQGR